MIEYATEPMLREWAKSTSQEHGFSLLLTGRALDQLGEAVDLPMASRHHQAAKDSIKRDA